MNFQVDIKRTRRKRSVGIRVTSGCVHVMAPHWVSEGELHHLLIERSDWIQQKLAQAAAIQVPAPLTVEGGLRPVRGVSLAVEVKRGRHAVIVGDAGVCLQLPEPTEEAVQKSWRLHLQALAESHLVERVTYFSTRLQVEPTVVKFRRYRARWGSCSASHAVSFHWPIIQAPDWVSDYLVVHELAHIRHFDHSPGFWRCVESVLPDWKKARLWLRNEGRWILDPTALGF